MTARRAVLLVLTVLLVLGAGTGAAVAAWQSSNTGTSTGRAGTLTAPADIAVGTPACSGTTGTTGSVRFSWTAPAGAVSYQVDIATNTAFTTGFQTAATSNTYATVSQTNAVTKNTIYFRARSVAGTWVSANSSTATGTTGPCP